ncbi:autotransporter outer membrane beta-barrel domain-containing protein [Oricola indica]|uniref:autotransporter outer membrane beta-barrel domain-containing protein n=1 Tax=Oricola indica TaxID=2872591 RepID=UPI003CCBB119
MFGSALLLGWSVVMPGHSLAQQYWDGGDGTANGSFRGGSGTWDMSTANWTNAAGSANSAYVPGTAAIFDTYGGTVQVSGTQAFSGISINADGYQFLGDALAIQDSGGSIAVAAGSTATFANVFADQGPGTGALTVNGGGLLVLTGSNTFSGGTTVASGGGLKIGNGGVVGGVSNASGAIFEVQSGGSSGTTSNAGTLTNNGTLASLTNTGGTATNNGTINGIVSVSAGIFTNNGTVSGTSSISGGTTDIHGTMTGLVTVFGGTLNSDGTFGGGLANSGGIVNAEGTLNGPITNNSGSFGLTGDLSGDGQFDTMTTLNLNGYSLSGFSGFAASGGTVSFATGSGIDVGSGTISSSGTLSFNGANALTANLVSLTGGTLDMDNGTVGDVLSVDGNFDLGSGATWTVNVDHLEQGDSVSVSGMVTLAGGLSVEALPPESSYPAGPASLDYTLISNDGVDAVSGTFSGVVTNYAFLMPFVDYAGGDGNDVVLTLDIPSVAPDFTSFAMNENQQQTALALADFDYSSADGTDVLDAFNLLTNNQVPGVLDQVGAGKHLAPFHMNGAVFGAFINGISDHMRRFRPGEDKETSVTAYAEDQPRGLSGNGIEELYGDAGRSFVAGPVFWTAGQGDYKKVVSDGNGAEMRLATGSVLTGVEYQNGSGDAVGAAFGYARSGFSTDGLSGSATADSYQVALYANTGAADPLATGPGLTGAIGYARHLHDTTRDIGFGGLSREATANYQAETYGGEMIARYGFAAPGSGAEQLTLSPFAGVRYLHGRNDAFTESGAGTLNLSSAAFSTDHLNTKLGVEIAGMFVGDSGSVRPSASFGWKHEFLDTSVTGDFTLAGSPTAFQAVSTAEARDEYFAAMGADIGLSANTRLQLGVDAGYSKSITRLGASAAFSTAF